jgi:hypothetical protein
MSCDKKELPKMAMLNRCNKYGLFSNYLRWMAMFFVLIFHGGIPSP